MRLTTERMKLEKKMKIQKTKHAFFLEYSEKLTATLMALDWENVEALFTKVRDKWQNGNSIFLCGNGGSAGNAIHLANDLLFGPGNGKINGLSVIALPANSAVITCLANDVGYENIYSYQLVTLAKPGDMVIILSGSGNSTNVIRAIETAKSLGLDTSAIVGFDGGVCKKIVDQCIHTPVDDMQISEDLQLIIGHILMKWLKKNPIKLNG